MNINRVRKNFPILRKKKMIYFDNAATTLTPNQVINKMNEYYTTYQSNINRGMYESSQLATNEYNKAKKKIQNFIGAKSLSEIVVTKSTTEGINLIANGLDWKKGDNIITTTVEHHSNYLPWLRIKNKYNIELNIISLNNEGELNLEEFENIIDNKTKLIALTHISNVLGKINPIEKFIKIAHEYGTMVLIDGAQSVPHIEVNVKKLDCDILAFSGHKMCGPTGVGILYIKDDLQKKIYPLNIGGGSIEWVDRDKFKLSNGSEKFEAGTPPIAGVLGLGEAVEYLKSKGMSNIYNHEKKLLKILHEELSQIKEIQIYGNSLDDNIGIISFNIKGLFPHDIALSLDISNKICVRSGLLCAEPLIKDILNAPNGVIRLSTYLYNNEKEIHTFIKAINNIINEKCKK